MPVFLAAAASSGASPAPAPAWLADVVGLSRVNGSTGIYETGIWFTVPSAKTCIGVKMEWDNAVPGLYPYSVKLSIWNVTTNVLVSSETVTITANGPYQTTAAFGSHVLLPGPTYAASIFQTTGSLYNGYGTPNPYAIPRAYADYSVVGPYAYSFSPSPPGTVVPGVCGLVEPLIV